MALLLRPHVHGLIVDDAALVDTSTNSGVGAQENQVFVAVARLSVGSSRYRDEAGSGRRIIDPSCRAVWHLTL